MAIKINSNGQSLAAQRQVAQTSDSLGRVFERSSSGQRINRASDDAAGLAIADTLNAKSRVFTAGVRNLNDGISLLSVADAAVGALTDITVRLKELAEQSANGVYSSKQRQALDNEAQALSKEFTRITQSTTFNGLNLFDGSVQGLRLQAGFGTDGSILSSLGGAKGSGTFASTNSFSTGAAPRFLSVGDFNGDGVLDLVSADSNGTASILLGQGDGTFQARATLGAGITPRSVNTADLNGDGILDLVTADSGSNTASIFLGRGDGTFQVRSTIATGTSPSTVITGDFDGDGILDLVSADTSSFTASIFLGRGDGTFKARITIDIGNFPNSISAADFNGDGILDLVNINTAGNTASISLGRGDGSFQVRNTVNTGGAPSAVTIGDLNGDGIVDFITADASDNTASIFLGRGDGTFQARRTVSTGGGPNSISTGDFNGDGILDFISADSGDNTASIFLGKGDGTFQNRTTAVTGPSPSFVAAADFNGDGILDFASTSAAASNASIFIGKARDGIGVLNLFSLKTKSDSLQAISGFDNKLKSLSAQRGTIGTFQSRVTTAINVLQSSTENFKAAESRIRDTDVAEDSAELTRLQILQQAGVSVLSQANLQPQLALKLLQN